MNKKLKIVTLILWIIVAVLLLSILVSKISSGSRIGFNINLNGKEFSNIAIQKEESISLDSCSNINIDFSSEEIKVITVDDDDLKIIQESSKTLNDDEKFTITKTGDTITVQKNNIKKIINLFSNNGVQRIQVLLPTKYKRALNVTTSSGDINIASPLALSDINCSASSGEISASNTLQIDNKAIFKLSSGDIKINGLSATDSSFNSSSGEIILDGTILSKKSEIKITSGDIKINELNSDYDIQASSGEIKVKSLLSGSGTIDSTSGDIDVTYKGISDYSNIKCSSGSVHANVDKSISFEFEGKCSSGDINSNFDLNYKNKKKNEASTKIGTDPYKKLDINTTSGDINIKTN